MNPSTLSSLTVRRPRLAGAHRGPAPQRPAPDAPAALPATDDPAEEACRRAWQALREPAVRALLAAPLLRAARAPAEALQHAFDSASVPGAIIETEVRRALAQGPSDATLLALTLLAAVALERFHGGPRALALAQACSERARAADAAAVAGPVLRAHAALLLARSGPLRDAALQQAEACRLEAPRPDTLARNAVLWTGVRMLCGAPLAELVNHAEAVRQAVPPRACSGRPSVIACQLDGRIALLRLLADGPRFEGATALPPADALQFGCWLTCLQGAWLRANQGAARAALDAAQRLVTPLTPACELLPFHLFAVLTLARGGAGAHADRLRLRQHRRALQAWAQRMPDDAAALAELARAAEQTLDGGTRALGMYESAAALAQGRGLAWVAALAWEGAAELCDRAGLAGALPGYRRLALDAWRDWGAHGRVRALMQAWDCAPGGAAVDVHGERARAARAETVGELGITIAHEVNQPLAAILLHAAAARRWLRRAEPDPARALDALEQISACGRQAGDIIRSVRGLARREGEDVGSFALDTALAEVVHLLRALMLRQGVQLDTDLQLPDRRVHASRAQIQQVLMNLLLNAIEALAGVSGRQRRIHVDSRPLDGALVELRVRDNGPGIALPDRERIFETLYSTKPHGTGVGLSISRAIVEAHGGRIEFVPVEPHGAMFRVVLPLARGAIASTPNRTRDHA